MTNDPAKPVVTQADLQIAEKLANRMGGTFAPLDRPALLAAARYWWSQNMPSDCTNVVIGGDGRVAVYWQDKDESGKYTLPVDFARHRTTHSSPDEKVDQDGALPSDRATAAEPVVSALRDGIPSADFSHYTVDDYDYDLGDCWNCGGEGYVYGCSWDWQCDTYDEGEGSCLCTRVCHICHPPKDDPALRQLMGNLLAQGGEAGTAKTGTGLVHEHPVAESHAPDVQPLYPASAIEAAQIAARNEALAVVVSRDEAVKWCEHALRNVQNLELEWDDIADIAEALTQFRREALRTPSQHQEEQ